MISKLKLVVHAGPMKTGSTAFQNFCLSNSKIFEKMNIMYSLHKYGDEFLPFAKEIINRANENNCRAVLISGEFICVQKSINLIKAFDSDDIQKYAILIKRPLKHLYVSRYLQSLKGPWASSKTFEEFIERQKSIDAEPIIKENKTTFNYKALIKNLEVANFEVQQLEYSKDKLIFEIIKNIESNFKIKFSDQLIYSFKDNNKLSPLYSLNLCFAPAVREINILYRQNKISQPQRSEILHNLLVISKQIPKELVFDQFKKELNDIENYDSQINGTQGFI